MYPTEGGFNISTGIFSVGYSGTWRITASANMKLAHIFIHHNNQEIRESKFTMTGVTTSKVLNKYSKYEKSTGSRTLLMHLDTGDRVYLRSDTSDYHAKIVDIIFCVELVQFDD